MTRTELKAMAEYVINFGDPTTLEEYIPTLLATIEAYEDVLKFYRDTDEDDDGEYARAVLEKHGE